MFMYAFVACMWSFGWTKFWFVELNTEWDMVVDLDASCCNIYLRGTCSLCALVLSVINETVGETCHIWALAVQCSGFHIVMHKVRTSVLGPEWWWCVHLTMPVIWSANWMYSAVVEKFDQSSVLTDRWVKKNWQNTSNQCTPKTTQGQMERWGIVWRQVVQGSKGWRKATKKALILG